MQPIHAQIAEPTVLATARPQDGAGVMSVGVAHAAHAAWRMPTAGSTAWTTNSSFRSQRPRRNKSLTCDGTLRVHTRHGSKIGGGLQNRIEVRPA